LSYYGLDGEPVNRGGVHRYAYIYDERGNEVERSWYGTDGNLIEGVNGNSIMRRTFDDRGNRIAMHFLDANRERMALNWGPAGYLSEYDEYDREIHRQYIGVSGEAILLPENRGGYSAISYEYDAVGNTVAEAYTDEAGMPVAFAGRGFSNQKSTYDQYRNVTSYHYFDSNGALIEDDWMAKISIEYDDQGHMTNRRFYNSRDELMLAPGTQRAGEDISYDDYGRVILNRSIGLEEEPIERADFGWSEMRTSYDEWNNATQTCFKLSGEQVDCN
jgi:YD repeat-containing protein